MNKFTSVAAAFAVLSATSSYALETAQGTATVTVQNSFSFSQATALDFGTIRTIVSSADGTPNVVTMTLPADGSNPTIAETTAGTGNTRSASMNVITPGTPGEFTVSNAAPNTRLTITLPGTFNLTNGSGGPTFLAEVTEALITSGTSANSLYDGTNNFLTTDATGNGSFSVGGTLSTDASGNAQNYQDVAYTGQYTITVDYQ